MGQTDSAMGGAGYAGRKADWQSVCARARALTPANAAAARIFFEAEFVPYRVRQDADGLFTGYYEPELKGSRTRHDAFQTPLYGVPADLVTVDLGLFREALKGQRLAGRVVEGRLVPYATRADIERNGLANAATILYVDDPADAFFLQIQGSGRVVLDDGSVVRAAYAGQNGQPYTAIGGVLVEIGELTRENVSVPSIRAWLAANPERAASLLDKNASYVFFSVQPLGDANLGASGSEDVPLTPEGSIAVDPAFHPFGVPIWLETSAPDADAHLPERSFERLLVAQDTGGAIKGAVRGDIYWGFGAKAGAIAGRMRSLGSMTVLLPKQIAARLGVRAEFPGPRS